jgi:tetratricopeptide (TPR) repeat protein
MKAILNFLIPFLVVMLLPSSGIGQQFVEYIGQGDYLMGDGETPSVAESKALKLAERDAAEKAGVFIKSFTLVKDQTVIEDIIEAVATHSMSVQIMEKKRFTVAARGQGAGEVETLKFSVKIKATFQKMEIEKNMKMIRENSKELDSYQKLKKEYENQKKELNGLKRKLSGADGSHRQDILKQIGDGEKHYKAIHLIEAGELASRKGEKMSALESFTSAIALRPEFALAYAMRGTVYMELDRNDRAFTDVQRAIDLDPKDAFYYAMRGAIIFGRCSKGNLPPCEQALKDIKNAIRLQPNSSELYLMRAGVYLETNRNKEALEDLTRAINLNRKEYWPGSAGIAYMLMINTLKDSTNDLHGVLEYLTTAISIITNSKYYLNVLEPLSEVSAEIRNKNATEDQAKEILARKLIDVPDEKTRMIRTDNLNFVFTLYSERADVYTKLGYPENAKSDMNTACRIIWNDEICKTPVFQRTEH